MVGSPRLVGLASSSAARSPVGLPRRRRMTAGCAPTGGAMAHVGGAWIAPIDIGSAGVTGPAHWA